MLSIDDEGGRNLLGLLATMWSEGKAAPTTPTILKPSTLIENDSKIARFISENLKRV